MTPESKIKRAISAVLRNYGSDVYYHMSVPTGYGRSTLDYLGSCCGLAFAIEAKAPGERPTARQRAVIDDLEASGAAVFVISHHQELAILEGWLSTLTEARRISRTTTSGASLCF